VIVRQLSNSLIFQKHYKVALILLAALLASSRRFWLEGDNL